MAVFRRSLCVSFTATVLLLASAPVFAQTALAPALVAKVDQIASSALTKSGVPSASVAVV